MIAMAFKILFWASVACLFYAYAGYPLLLFFYTSMLQMVRDLRFIITRRERRAMIIEDELPTVSLVVAAYNEADVIADKIENALAIDYPREKLEIIIASDGSTDATNEIAASYANRGVRLMAYAERRGKVSVINRTVPQAAHDIVVLSDATTMYEAAAIKNAVKHFRGDKVGVVVGEVILESVTEEYKGESHYWRYEVMIKFMENRLGAVVGASGALCALRKELFEPVPDSTIIDDFVIPLKIAEKGYRQVYAPEARVVETTAADVQAELVRRKRIAAGDFQSIFLLWRLLNPLRGYIALAFISHKIMRWSAPFFMAGALVANAALVRIYPYSVLFALQVLFYGSAWAGWRARRRWVRKLCSLQYYFVSMNIGLAQGFFNFVRGKQAVTWGKTHRAGE